MYVIENTTGPYTSYLQQFTVHRTQGLMIMWTPSIKDAAQYVISNDAIIVIRTINDNTKPPLKLQAIKLTDVNSTLNPYEDYDRAMRGV